MNRDRWLEICRQLKGRLVELSFDPMTAAAGTRERLAGRIQELRGIVKQVNQRELEDFLARNRNWRHLTSR